MEDEWSHSYKLIKESHDEAYHAVDRAIKFEEEERPELALAHYKLGIAMIDEALATPVALPEDEDSMDETWNRALEMIQKMKRSRAEILLRIGTLSAKIDPKGEIKAANNGTSETVDGRPRTFAELADALRHLEYGVDEIPNTLELLFLCEGVKLYSISASGEVTTADECNTLRIVRLEKDATKNLDATYFMQIIKSSVATQINIADETSNVENATKSAEKGAEALASAASKPSEQRTDGSFIYPLVPKASPCFLTEYGAFIFPDLESAEAGSAIGLVIPPGSAEVALEILEAILHGVVKQAGLEAEGGYHRPRRALSDTISSGIVRGAFHLSNGLVKGSEKMGEFMSYSTPYIISKLNKAPPNAPPVSNKVVGGVEIAKSATCVAVNVTGYVAGKVGTATMALGRFLAPHVQIQGSKLLTSTTGMDPAKASETVCAIHSINLLELVLFPNFGLHRPIFKHF